MIYLDHNATTPIDPEVAETMAPFIATHFGNPSSGYAFGKYAKTALTEARNEIKAAFQAEQDKVIFTGGGSEANNLAIKGMAYALRQKGNHMIISSIEHPAITGPAAFLKKNGYEVDIVPVDEYGVVDPEKLRGLIKPGTVLISVMLANNEVGSIQPVAEIAEIARSRGILTHTDAAQAVGKIAVGLNDLGVDMISIAGHKFYAPKGVGALILRDGLNPEPLIHGAGHEYGFRAGTENTPYIVALGKAATLASQRLPEYQDKVAALRDKLHQSIIQGFPGAVLNGHPEKRLPNTLNLSFPGIDAAKLMTAVSDRIACSTGSACHSGAAAPSLVLTSMGKPLALSTSALRLSLGFHNTEEEIIEAGNYLVSKIRQLI